MIKSDIQLTEAAVNLPPINLSKNINASFSMEETKLEIFAVEKTIERPNVRIHFSRLKKRMRSRSTSIF